MPYSTLDTLKLLISDATLLQLCDDDNVGAFVVDPANTAYMNLQYAIDQADGFIDSLIGTKYTVPVATLPVPPVLRDASANLAICNLFDRRREMDVPEGVAARRKSTIKWLESVRDGKAIIPEIQGDRPSLYAGTRSADEKMFPDEVLNQY